MVQQLVPAPNVRYIPRNLTTKKMHSLFMEKRPGYCGIEMYRKTLRQMYIYLCRYCIILWGKHVEIACFYCALVQKIQSMYSILFINTCYNGLFIPQLKTLHVYPKITQPKVLLNLFLQILHYFVGKTCGNCLPVTQYLLYDQ